MSSAAKGPRGLICDHELLGCSSVRCEHVRRLHHAKDNARSLLLSFRSIFASFNVTGNILSMRKQSRPGKNRSGLQAEQPRVDGGARRKAPMHIIKPHDST